MQITEGMLYAKENRITLDELVDENGVVSFDISNFDKYLHSIYLVYEDEKDSFI